MTDGQERAWSALGPRYLLDVPRDAAITSILPGSTIDPSAVWGRVAPLIVEIGSGQGHAIVHAASTRPDDDFLAIEVFLAGLARTMRDADRAGVQNLRLVEANAPEVLAHLLPAASVDELWIFFPDPWHKNKHTKRRMITDDFAAIAAAAVRPGGTVRMATDWEDYALQMRTVLDAAPGFVRDFADDWAPRFDGRVLTAFEQKGARVGRAIRDLAYRRTDHPAAASTEGV
ncbi:tRNA (guanosine(46)-N7)-methyltransferase TrmB [Microbacterium sp. P01]|uniref:tRNA (guanosine(46)-N7)-methyltransferase TrmB n=1 Tax=unclassified Microbacterium TaxID=2609290 RepID=UPI00366B9BA7